MGGVCPQYRLNATSISAPSVQTHLAIPVQVAVDGRGQCRQLRNQVHSVLICILQGGGKTSPRPLLIQYHTHLPVLSFRHATRVPLCKLALGLHSCDGSAELGHGVQLGGEAVHKLHHVRRESRTAGQISGDGTHLQKGVVETGLENRSYPPAPASLSTRAKLTPNLIHSGDLPSEQEVEDALGEWLLSALCLGQEFLALWDAVAPEANAFLGVQQGGFRH